MDALSQAWLVWRVGLWLLWRYRVPMLVVMGVGLGVGYGFWRLRRNGAVVRIGWGWPLAGALAWLVRWLPSGMLRPLALALTVLGLYAGLWLVTYLWKRRHHRPFLLWMALNGLVALPWNLAALQDLVVPPYYDAARHTYWVQKFLLKRQAWFFQYPYHGAFHGLAAWAPWAEGSFHPLYLLVTALVLTLFVLPAGVYAFVWRIYRHAGSALLAAWAAVAAWPMPLYALAWGKYPALFGVSIAPLLLLEGLASRKTQSRAAALRLLAWTALVAFTHARVGLLAGGLAALLYRFRGNAIPQALQRRYGKYVLLALSYGLLLVAAIQPMLFRMYQPRLWFLLLILNLLAWFNATVRVWWAPSLAFAALLGVLTFLPSPVRWVRPYIQQVVWVDRPFFELALPAVLSLWIALLFRWVDLHAAQRPGLRVFLYALLPVLMLTGWWTHRLRVPQRLMFLQEEDLTLLALLAQEKGQGEIVVLGPKGYLDATLWLPVYLETSPVRLPREAWWLPLYLRPVCSQGKPVWAFIDLAPPGLAVPPQVPWLHLTFATSTALVYRVACGQLPP